MASKINPNIKKLLSKITYTDNGCWIYNEKINNDGYGYIIISNGDMWPAHRLSYWYLVGQFDLTLEIDHLCRIRNCINPDHLDAVTHAENIRRKNPCHPAFNNPDFKKETLIK